MQKFFNVFYAIALFGIIAFAAKTQLFDKVRDVRDALEQQNISTQQMRADIIAIVNAVNQQLVPSGQPDLQTQPAQEQDIQE